MLGVDRATVLEGIDVEDNDRGEAMIVASVLPRRATKRRCGRCGRFIHLDLFGAEDWGLVVYDEVHLLPAPVFRMTADPQSRRRLGLTATLVREDGKRLPRRRRAPAGGMAENEFGRCQRWCRR